MYFLAPAQKRANLKAKFQKPSWVKIKSMFWHWAALIRSCAHFLCTTCPPIICWSIPECSILHTTVFCIPQSVIHTILRNSNTWHAPLLSTGAYQTTRVQYALHSILHSITHCSQILDIPICHTPHTRMYYSNTHMYSNMYLTYQNYILCIPESSMHTLLKYISQ